MAFQFPWTNFHELNLDWFLSKFKQFTDNFLGTTATAESVPYGTQPTVTVTGGELDDDTDIVDPFTFNFKIPAGAQGEQGEQGVPGVPGQDGFSPIATVTKSGTVATITITDANGTTTTTISDGEVTQAQLDTKAPAILSTASGSTAHFSDGADDLPISELTVGIVPVQSGSGDPAPDNIRPISGWTGCNVVRTGGNVWDEEWENGFYSRITGVKAGNSDTTYIRSKNYIPCTPNTSYYFKAPSVHASNNTYYAILFYGADKSYISAINSGIGNTARTTPQNAHFMTFYIEVGTSGATYQNDISINYPSTDTDYHSGTDNITIPISWQNEAGTVYGGTIDVAAGLLTVDRAMVTMTGADVNYVGQENALWRIYTDALNDRFAGANVPYSISNKYSYIQAYTSINQINNSYGFSTNIGQIFIHDDTFTSLDDIKASLNSSPLEIVYTLATPQTYQITPQQLFNTLYGGNNVWSNVGDSTVTYTADTMLYIQNLTQPTEDDMVANTAIANGKFFMIGNNLYRATTTIASGSQIIPGTNATPMSLADALNLL